jgi:hypothetical protein
MKTLIDPNGPACLPGQPARLLGPRPLSHNWPTARKSVGMTGFKNFIMRGNLVELAVAVVIGTQ